MQKTKNNKGFSLVELIVVILIIAIIGVALTPSIMKWVTKAQASNEVQNYNSIVSALGTEALALSKLSGDVYIAMDSTGSYITSDAAGATKVTQFVDGSNYTIVKNSLESVLPGWSELKANGSNKYMIKVNSNGVSKIAPPDSEAITN